MIVNFRTHGISRGMRKLTCTPILIQKKIEYLGQMLISGLVEYFCSPSTAVSYLYYKYCLQHGYYVIAEKPYSTSTDGETAIKILLKAPVDVIIDH